MKLELYYATNRNHLGDNQFTPGGMEFTPVPAALKIFA